MNKNLFTESQVRQIIEKSHQIASSNNGSIPISNLEDAASLAAYIAGYSSWKQYRKEQKKLGKLELKSEIQEDEATSFNLLTIDSSPIAILELKTYLKSLTNKESKPELKENKQLLYKIEVGQVYNKLTKATQICHLDLENSCFVGDNFKFLGIAQNSLVEQLQTIIEFNAGNKQGEKLDPINEIFSGDYLEDFLSQGSQDNKNFAFIWGLLVKQLFEQYKFKFTAEFLMKTLELEFVMKAWCMLYQEGNFLANMLMGYIKSLPQIKIEPSKIILSKDAQEKHWENIKKIHSQLSVLKEAYDQNIFSYDGLKLIDCMVEKKNADISVSMKAKDFIFNVIDFVIDCASRSYQKHVEGLDAKEHAVFIINKHEKLNKVVHANDYVFSFVQLLPYASSQMSNFEQIIFTKHSSFIQPDNEFIIKFYMNTPNVEKNLFANSGEALINLEENYAYLWKKENKEAETGSFVMHRIAY